MGEASRNHTPSSIDFKLTSYDNNSATPKSFAPSSSQKTDAPPPVNTSPTQHNLDSIQAYMLNQDITEFNVASPKLDSLQICRQ